MTRDRDLLDRRNRLRLLVPLRIRVFIAIGMALGLIVWWALVPVLDPYRSLPVAPPCRVQGTAR